MTNSLPPPQEGQPTENKSLLWILAVVAAIVIIVVVLSAACRAPEAKAPGPLPQTSISATPPNSPSPVATSDSPKPLPTITTSPLVTWPSEEAKSNYLKVIASVDPSIVGSQEEVDAVIRMGIATCEYLDEAVRISDNEQAIVLTGMDVIVKSLVAAGVEKDRAVKIAAVVINASVTTMCPEHKALVSLAITPESTT